jgi:hypothetical protein
LLGRGIAALKIGDREGGQADIAAAEAAKPGVSTNFARWGVMPSP